MVVSDFRQYPQNNTNEWAAEELRSFCVTNRDIRKMRLDIA